MSNATLSLPAFRRLALSASRLLERWALEVEITCSDQLCREEQAYVQALADRERYALLALHDQPLR